VAHLALRQRDDRLQEQLDAIGLDRACEPRDDLGRLEPAERPARHHAGGLPLDQVGSAPLSGFIADGAPRPAGGGRGGGAGGGGMGEGGGAAWRGGGGAASALSSIWSCAATASARSFTSPPSSLISVASGAVTAWARCAVVATSFSSATMRRSSSETWRAMSA